MLELNNVVIRLRDTNAELLRVDHLTVQAGQIQLLMGPSGKGKSTLLRWLSGEAQPAFAIAGQVLLDGVDITAQPTTQRRLGLLYQDVLLFPHLNVMDNLAFALPPHWQKKSRAEKQTYLTEQLAKVDMAEFGQALPATLSGGQRARIGLLRALINEPKAMLLDEPFAALDATLREQIRNWAYGLLTERGIPSLVVSHDEMDKAHEGQVTYV